MKSWSLVALLSMGILGSSLAGQVQASSAAAAASASSRGFNRGGYWSYGRR